MEIPLTHKRYNLKCEGCGIERDLGYTAVWAIKSGQRSGKCLDCRNIKHDKQFKKGFIPWNKGTVGYRVGVKRGSPSKATREKMSLARMGRSPWNKDKVGVMPVPWNKGNNKSFEWTDEQKANLKAVRKKGPESHNWIADRSKVKLDTERGGPLHKQWSISVKNRDGWKCKISNHDCEGRMEAHHILSWSNHPKLRYEINNGITLCHAHHPRKRAEEVALAPVFQGLVSMIAN